MLKANLLTVKQRFQKLTFALIPLAVAMIFGSIAGASAIADCCFDISEDGKHIIFYPC